MKKFAATINGALSSYVPPQGERLDVRRQKNADLAPTIGFDSDLIMGKAHHKLLAWQLGLELVESVYRMTSVFPDTERYGLISQMRRASVSVPANIAEGAARNSDREFQRFLCIARASLTELETFVLLAKRLEYSHETDHLLQKINRVYGLVNGLIKQVRNKRATTNQHHRIGEQKATYSRLTSNVSPMRRPTLKTFDTFEALP